MSKITLNVAMGDQVKLPCVADPSPAVDAENPVTPSPQEKITNQQQQQFPTLNGGAEQEETKVAVVGAPHNFPNPDSFFGNAGGYSSSDDSDFSDDSFYDQPQPPFIDP